MPPADKKYYRLIISRLNGYELGKLKYRESLALLVEKGIGGFIIFGGTKDEVTACIAELQTLAKERLVIACDIERGVGQHLEGALHFPTQMAVAAATDLNNISEIRQLEKAITMVAQEAAQAGINMPLIPVLDINSNPDNPIICTRAFSDNPATVAGLGKIYISAIEGAGLISCAKHFPGHGDTDTDSHIDLPLISKSLNDLRAQDLVPFAAAIQAGISSIMLGHLSIPAIDHLPASLSKRIVTGLLKEELGFPGLILTDALNMHALREYGSAATGCINAGADIILHPDDADTAASELAADVASGALTESKIDKAAARINEYVKKTPLDQTAFRLETDAKAIFTELYERSITLIHNSKDIVPLKDTHKISLMVCGDDTSPDISTLKELFGCPLKFTDETSNIDHDGILLVGIFTNIAAWHGSSGISSLNTDMIKLALSSFRRSIVISFGSPYVLRHFMEADTLIAAYDSSLQAQQAAMRCLMGEISFKGNMPISL